MTWNGSRLSVNSASTSWHGVLVGALALASWTGNANAEGSGRAPADLDNVARGRPYTLDPAPNYPLCTDEGDATQLTDGRYTPESESFWTQESTVGWQHVRRGQVSITLDLGEVTPIRGLSFSTAAGKAGVAWPSMIFVLVSDDGENYHSLGDLLSLSAPGGVPPRHGYATHRYRTQALRTHGRYVRLLVRTGGIFAFVDEIEVYRGEAQWIALPLPGPVITDPQAYVADPAVQTLAAIHGRLHTDLRRCREALDKADVSDACRARLSAELDAVEGRIEQVPAVQDPAAFKAIFPLNDVHAQVFAVNAAIAEAAGAKTMVAWAADRWEFLTPTQPPPRNHRDSRNVSDAQDSERQVSIAAMQGETRSGAFNLTNSTRAPADVRIRIEGLPGGSNPSYVRVHRVEWTDTKESVPVAAALPEVEPEGNSYHISVPAGMTRQVWIRMTPRDVPAGTHRGRIVIERDAGAALELPLTLRVFDVAFPQTPSLHLGGWDYSDRDTMYGLTPENTQPLIEYLRANHVDTPWASSQVLPHGSFDAQGGMVKRPDTAHFDRWVGRWPGARRYAVFALVGDRIGKLARGTSAFDRAVGEWITFWIDHAAGKGIDQEQILLLLVDEPKNVEQAQRTIDWATPIQAATPGVVVFSTPVYQQMDQAPAEFWQVLDTLCPHRPHLLNLGRSFEDFYRGQREAGKALEFYSCSGPAFHLDPYSYYRLQAWTCFDMGAEATSFWAFADTGVGGSWNPYIHERMSYTPLFLGPDSVTPGKHMEAIRESVQDYEYLVMLRDRILEIEGTHPDHPMLTAAKKLLEDACGRVLDAEGAAQPTWTSEKDRAVADRVLVEVGVMLERLD